MSCLTDLTKKKKKDYGMDYWYILFFFFFLVCSFLTQSPGISQAHEFSYPFLFLVLLIILPMSIYLPTYQPISMCLSTYLLISFLLVLK